jgi:hypothetical protein
MNATFQAALTSVTSDIGDEINNIIDDSKIKLGQCQADWYVTLTRDLGCLCEAVHEHEVNPDPDIPHKDSGDLIQIHLIEFAAKAVLWAASSRFNAKK